MGKKKEEKVVDLKPQKISEEQLQKIQQLVNILNTGQMELGMLETKKHRMLHEIAALQDQLNGVQKELEEQYGTFDVNIQDGTINYKEDEPSDS
jgi:heterodisulfide reductase subunit C